MQRTAALALLTAAFVAPATVAFAQRIDGEPAHRKGQNVTPAFEGWFPNKDGSFSIMAGYWNRNLQQALDIPVGPDNKIEPGGPDMGQPTHFMSGRGWGPFTIRVPKDFGDKELTWTITVNGKTASIPLNIKDLWQISPYVDALNNTPPWLAFSSFDDPNNGMGQGQNPVVTSKTARVGQPLPLTVYVADDGVFSPGRNAPKELITLSWSEYRAPEGASVKFSDEKPKVEKEDFKKMPPKAVFAGKATTNVTFSDPGDYDLYLAVNDASGVGGGGGFQCCWTNGHVKVTVTK